MTLRDPDGHILLERKVEPFEVGVLLICLLYGGLGQVWFERLAGRAIKLYPVLGGRAFLALLFLGSLTALAGLALPTIRGLRMEHAGLWLLVYLGAGYAVWTPFSAGVAGLPLMLFFGMMLFVPGFFVARKRGKLIQAAENPAPAPPLRSETWPDANG